MATQVETAVSWAKSKVGSYAWNKYCQKFVDEAYQAAGMGRHYIGSAYNAYKHWAVYTGSDRTAIPVGAAVYFSCTKHSNGHVGLYIGNGQMIHAWGSIKITTVSYVADMASYKYLGWGWNGGTKPTGAGYVATSVTAKSKAGTTSGTYTATSVTAKSKANAGVSTGTTSTAGNTKSIQLSTQNGTTALVEVVKKDITKVVIQSTNGKTATQARTLAATKDLNTGLEIFLHNGKIYKPRIEGEVTLEQPRSGGPATLKFTCCKDEVLNFQEGNPVSMRYNGVGIFFGFVFTKKRQDSFLIDVTAYDQLRYLKNEDTISYENKTYAQLVKLLADSYGLTCGTLEDTSYTMSRIEEGTLLDMLGNAADETLLHTKKQYVLYDEYGALTLKNISSMRVPILVDAQTAQSFDYKTSIDSKVYTRAKMALDDDTTGQRNVYVYNDTDLQGQYGVLQYYEKVQEGTTTANMQEKAKSILSYYGQKRRNLTVSKVFGDIRVRGGCSLAVDLNLGDLIVKNYMVVENVTHRWEDGSYCMDLTLTGIKGEFVA